MIAGLCLVLLGAPGLPEAAELLADYDPDGALAVLRALEATGGRAYADNVALYELLGQAHAYKADRAAALAAFSELLTLDPAHVLDYGLPPQVTLLFEEARRAARLRPAPGLQVTWPDELGTRDPIPLSLRAQNDTDGRFKRARVRAWTRGGEPWVEELALERDATTRALIPALAATASTAVTLSVAAELFDARGNGVLAPGVGGAGAWQIPLAHQPEPSWYEHWWVWALVGAGAVAGTATALLLTQPEPATVDGVVSWRGP